MFPFIKIFNLTIPTYGLLIVFGFLLANAIAYYFIKKLNDNFDNFLIFESYIFLGGFIGAKILYLFVSRNQIDWSKITNLKYFASLMQGGFVFYGGLIGGILSCFLCGLIHKIDVKKFVKRYCFLVPLAHGFGRIGCFCAGCCYGKPYDGFLAVTFPSNSFGLSGIPLFPIQLLEAALLFVIFVILLILFINKKESLILPLYFLLYGLARFVLEYYRFDSERGFLWVFSTSQWISIGLILCGIILFVSNLIKNKKNAISSLNHLHS